jgi:hypothetical protein
MPNILYIGDPTSIHDLKWMSAFSKKEGYKAYLVAQDLELNKMKPLDHERLDANNIELLPSQLKFYSVWRQWDNQHSARVIQRAVKNLKIDLVHIFFIAPLGLNALYTNVPTVLTSRGSDALIVIPSLLKTTGLRKLNDWILFNLFKVVIKKSAAITCTSKPQEESLKRLFGAGVKTDLVRTGVDVESISTADFELSPIKKTDGKKMIFFPRYIQPIYNTIFQVEALKLLPTSILDAIQLVFVIGRNPDKQILEKVKADIEALQVEHRFVEYLDQSELWALYRTSDITVMTPKSDGTPNSGLEAMSARSHLILGNLPYDEDLFNTDSCIKMTSDKVDELARLIACCVKEPNDNRLETAFDIVSKKGNRALEMQKLNKVYTRILN